MKEAVSANIEKGGIAEGMIRLGGCDLFRKREREGYRRWQMNESPGGD